MGWVRKMIGKNLSYNALNQAKRLFHNENSFPVFNRAYCLLSSRSHVQVVPRSPSPSNQIQTATIQANNHICLHFTQHNRVSRALIEVGQGKLREESSLPTSQFVSNSFKLLIKKTLINRGTHGERHL